MIFVPKSPPLTGIKKFLEKLGFTESDYEPSNASIGSTLGISFMVLLCALPFLADGPKLKRDIKTARKNIRSRLGKL